MGEVLDNTTIDTITLEFVKQFLRIDHDFDDVEIQVAMVTAKSYVKKYVDEEYIQEPELIHPMLMIISDLYERKTTIINSNESYNHLFKDILWMCRGVSL